MNEDAAEALVEQLRFLDGLCPDGASQVMVALGFLSRGIERLQTEMIAGDAEHRRSTRKVMGPAIEEVGNVLDAMRSYLGRMAPDA